MAELSGPPAPVAASASLALLAFASNSILCRSALGGGLVDATTFTWVRLASGALVLGLVTWASGTPARATAAGGRAAGWSRIVPGLALALYAGAFSYAYLRIPAGIGALVLFGLTQVTMLAWGFRRGERPKTREWVGIATAFAGLVALSAPGRGAPDLAGVGLMAAAGVAWGAYSLLGRSAREPIAANASSFGVAAVLATLLFLLPAARYASGRGLVLAAFSGAVTSGLGYCLWYRALPHLTRTRAAALQLTVPVLAALLGVVLLGEALSLRLVACGGLVLAGVGLAVTARRG